MDGNVQLIDIIKSFTLESIIKPEKKKKVTVKGAKKLVLIWMYKIITVKIIILL